MFRLLPPSSGFIRATLGPICPCGTHSQRQFDSLFPATPGTVGGGNGWGNRCGKSMIRAARGQPGESRGARGDVGEGEGKRVSRIAKCRQVPLSWLCG